MPHCEDRSTFHLRAPVSASHAYTWPSSAPVYTVPSATVGVFLIRSPVVAVHLVEPLLASRAYSVDLSEPTYTVEPAIENDPRAAHVSTDQSFAPVFWSRA